MSIKNIKEKELLINLSKTFGQEVDPSIVEEVNRQKEFENNLKNSARQNWLKDLQEALKQVKVDVENIKEQKEYPVPPSLDDLEEFLSITTEEVNDLVSKPQNPETTSEQIEPEEVSETRTEPLAERAARAIKLNENSFKQPDPLLVPPDLNSIQKKIKFLEQWLGKISAHGPGGGAGNTIRLDYPVKLVTGDYTLTRNDYYVGVNAAATVNITIPSSIGFPGRKIVIKDESGRCSKFPIIVYGNVDNDPGGFILKINNGAIQMIYREGWRII
jgi:hypothetical protein